MAIIKNPLILMKQNSSGASLNIEYGNSAPSDTSKLWVKTSEPTQIEINSSTENFTPNQFKSLATFTGNMSGCAIAKVGNKVYIFGGLIGSAYSNAIYIYDIDTDTMTTSNATLTSATYKLDCAVVGNKIYIYGGMVSVANISNVYDIDNDTITALNTNISNNCYNGKSIAVGKYIYYFGGQNRASYPTYLGTVRKYDTETDTASNLPVGIPTQQGKINFGCCKVGDKIYLFGGVAEYTSTQKSDKISIFDINSETFTLSNATLTQGTSYSVMAFSIGLNIYVFCLNTNANYKYNIQTDTIEVTADITLPTNSIIYGNVAQDYTSAVFAGGGISALYSYTINVSLAENKMLLIYDIYAKFNIINTDTIKLKINPVDCYKGNSSNIGEQVKIALYDTTQQDWVDIN